MGGTAMRLLLDRLTGAARHPAQYVVLPVDVTAAAGRVTLRAVPPATHYSVDKVTP
jgi:hypothetical protein